MLKFLPVVYHTLFTAAMLVGLSIAASKSSAQSLATELLEANRQTTFSVSQATDNSRPDFIVNQRAIEVIGQGQATAPADIARLEFRFISRAPSQQPPPATVESQSEASSLPGEEPLKPVIDGLIGIKVPEDNIEIQTTSEESPKLLVTIDKPTRDRVQEVVKAVNSTLRNSNSLFIQGIGADYAVKDCQPLERAARRAALKDAQYQGKSIALEMGVKLGEVLYLKVYPIVSPTSVASCGSKVAVPVTAFFTTSETIPPYNPSDLPEIKVRSQIGITYAIEPLGARGRINIFPFPIP